MRYIALAAGILFVLSGCGSEPAPRNNSTDWSRTDPCGLLAADEIASYLGNVETNGVKSDQFGRPACTWTGAGSHKVKLMLWQPPAKDVIASPSKKTLKVGDKTGYMTVATSASCLLEVDGGPAFVSMDVFTNSGATDDAVCQKVAGTLTGVVSKLGW